MLEHRDGVGGLVGLGQAQENPGTLRPRRQLVSERLHQKACRPRVTGDQVPVRCLDAASYHIGSRGCGSQPKSRLRELGRNSGGAARSGGTRSRVEGSGDL